MTKYRIHPDMNELLAAKAAKPVDLDVTAQRAGHNAYGAALQRPYPSGMVVEDRAICCAGAGVDAELHCARGMIHGFVRARHSGPDAAAEFASICRSLRHHLGV